MHTQPPDRARTANVNSTLVLIGFFPKRRTPAPEGLQAAGVDEICSVSECLAPGPEGWVEAWLHNAFGCFNSPDDALRVAGGGAVEFQILAYRLLPLRFRSGIAESLEVEPPAAAALSLDFQPLGFDAVSKSVSDGFECSPLSCNSMALEVAVAHLDDAERRLEASGWFSEKGKLKMRTGAPGSRLRYLSQVVSGLYAYLWPMHRRTFGDRADNPVRLRHHISLLLSPYFSKREISPAERGSLQRLIGNFLERDPRASTVRAEALQFPAAPPSRRLYQIQNPVSSHSRSLIRSRRRLQKTNSSPDSGSAPSPSRTSASSPSNDLRMSTGSG